MKPFLIGRDLNRAVDGRPTRWIIDFGLMEKREAEGFPGAMRHVRKHVYPTQKDNRRAAYAKRWWRFAEARPGLREALRGRAHVLVLPCVSPHLAVCRRSADICFDHQLMVIALGDFYHLGILQSRFHETWAWARGSTLEARLRYTNTTIFETFPFPLHAKGIHDPRKPPSTEKAKRVAALAKRFDKLRSAACMTHNLGLTEDPQPAQDRPLPELGEAYEAMNDAVAACYGFPTGVWRDEKETLRLLLERNRQVAEEGNGKR